jgi:hypothetical protein
MAGQGGYREGFIEHWLSRLLYGDLPWWVFEVASSLFAVLVGGDLVVGAAPTLARERFRLGSCQKNCASLPSRPSQRSWCTQGRRARFAARCL